MLKSRIGILIYLLLRNDLVWNFLSEEEKKIVFAANKSHNIGREDYKNPGEYGKGRVDNGENWDASIDRTKQVRGKILLEVLKKSQPRSVLELGPGPGFLTKVVCEYEAVKEYCGIDIGRAFLNYLAPRLENLQSTKTGFKYELICEDFEKLEFARRFDMIILLSTVHHIPNRKELFRKLSNMLAINGRILCIDPSHYLFRLYFLIRKIMMNPGILELHLRDLNQLSTHHFCTIGEYKQVALKSGLAVEDEWYFGFIPRRLIKRELYQGSTWLKYFSQEMAVLLKRET